ncbi:MAG: hypothetical protein AAFQ32_04655 [Pseudomonadota bacterium]
MTKIRQRVIYEIEGKTYPNYVSAEAAAVDLLGEEVDGLFNTIDTGNMRFTEQSKMLIQLVERLWENRAKIAPLLVLDYEPSWDIENMIENAKYDA